jgi:hypothetical protein
MEEKDGYARVRTDEFGEIVEVEELYFTHKASHQKEYFLFKPTHFEQAILLLLFVKEEKELKIINEILLYDGKNKPQETNQELERDLF